MEITYGNYGQRDGVLLNRKEALDLLSVLNRCADEGSPQDSTIKNYVVTCKKLMN